MGVWDWLRNISELALAALAVWNLLALRRCLAGWREALDIAERLRKAALAVLSADARGQGIRYEEAMRHLAAITGFDERNP